jgi:hypothetical protein
MMLVSWTVMPCGLVCTVVVRYLQASLTVTNTYIVDQPAKGGVATVYKKPCSLLALSIFPSPLTVMWPKLRDILQLLYIPTFLEKQRFL